MPSPVAHQTHDVQIQYLLGDRVSPKAQVALQCPCFRIYPLHALVHQLGEHHQETCFPIPCLHELQVRGLPHL